ncbi:MAG: bifunctional phosphopantothenoylcysteine decarboxylase/phosphopantothenate--cysteine ligase CoaBC [Gemmatimonadota bacterium]|nr:bifunctional phosphopantothenoylcysteine decarboxylase/phosphopantothenate--cysteine ligase CoaBC [Gemmatimonadota bacterium]
MNSPALSPRPPWQGRRVVLGVSGGVAAYKAVQVARDLTRLGADVDVIATRAAQHFVGALSFEGVTGRPVLTDMFSAEGAALHVRLGQEADAVAVAPATADLLARAAQGRADDLLTTTLLATRAPVVFCPAMNDRMFAHVQVQRNLAHCRDVLGYRIAGPETGALAAGEGDGPGRMLEPPAIVQHVGRALGASKAFEGTDVLVTSGPTREALDPVRFVGNRSSGRTGHALAEAAWRRGARVTLVSGPVALPPPTGAVVVRVESGLEMLDAVASRIGQADVVLFAAAVADFRPESQSAAKVKREGRSALGLELVANPDVAQETRAARKPGARVVGFALETEALVENAKKKLVAKGFDLVVANRAGEAGVGLEADANRVTLVDGEGSVEALPLMDKEALAEAVLDRVQALLEKR